MDGVSPDLRLEVKLARWGRAAVVLTVVVAALDWMGWATGIEQLTRVYPTWSQMTPWTALWLAGLGTAMLVQSGRSSPGRVWAGPGLAAVVGALCRRCPRRVRDPLGRSVWTRCGSGKRCARCNRPGRVGRAR